ncbi:amino acid adenylation domain-containing protein [Robbsia sp. Bb-Pol-6]|uniref:Amino acid adenylation domain-containing protein n=1 Tax=Robbsia betulipollinis TaxID=2981849 RepID=A0ABT3ZLN2_9BURK|nr:non-ribosomal peptide synthetase [Robbsia betulipollinis]MCY0386853.1 amino acid adenylation domain-containing protein [Robbsia betulipollinis]
MLAANRADDVALITVDAQGDTRYTYGEVARRAAALAAGLRARAGGSAAGARVLLMMDSGIDYVAAFFGCLYAGAIAVPAYAPESPREQHLARLRALADDADAAFIVTSAVLRDRLGAAFAAIAPRAECLAIGATGAVDAIGGEAGGVDAPIAPEARVAHPAAPADIAFLQYTSGSTSAPKGVMVTHGGLWANESAIREGLGVSAADVFVSWLPLYHDMGLIGTLSQPIFSGIPLVLMSPQYFLERPVRWLEAISRHRGTISGGPDFSYRLCAERLGDAQCAGLDLSSWRVAFSGAEPVRKATLDLFAARFAGAGFDARALFPCYGLAEATLYVSGAGTGVRAPAFDPRALEASRAHADDHGVALVSCGRPPSGHAIAIVDAASGAALENGHIGEILVRGPSLAAGYWRQPEATERTFVRRDGATWLRTGDLGFLHEGDVYIAGRIKDLLIVHGRNLYPQDLERTIEREVACVRPGRVAAFAVEVDGREGIGIAAELSRATRQRTTPEAAAASLTAAVALACGEPAGVVVLLNPGGLPKTSSGKVQRAACARGWSARSLDASAYFIKGHRMDAPAGEAAADAPDAPPLSPMERALADVWRETLPCLNARSPLAASDSFFAHGGDSLTAVQLAAAVRARWPVDYTVRDVFAAPALGEAAARIDTMRARAPVPAAPTLVRLPDAQRRVSRASASQRGLWLLWHRDPSSTAYNMNGELRIDGPLDAAALQRAFDAVIRRHDVLRARFAQDEEGEALQIVDAGMTVPLALTRLDAFSVPLQNAALTEITERTAHAPFDLERGPPMRAHLVVLGANAHRLLLSLHHIVADGWSVNLLLDGLAQSYRTQLAASGRADGTRGATPGAFSAAGDARPLQYADFVAWHSAAFDADAQARQLAYWRAQLADDGDPAAAAVLFDAPGRGAAGDPAGRQRCHAFCLPPAVAAALKGCAAPRRATPFMAMLAVFAVVLQRLSGKDDIRIGAPISLRKHAEAQSMVGYFIALHVLRTRMASHDDFAGLLAGVRDTVLAAQDHSDIAFDRLVSALLPRRALGSEALFQVKLTEQRPFAEQGFAPLAARLHVLPNEAAHFDLALDFTDTGERIDCVLAYDDGVFDAAFAERLASMFIALAQQLAAAPERALVDHAGRTLDGEAEPARNAPADRALPGPGADVLTRWRAHLAGAATRVALHDDGRCITFGELDAATDALARRLGASGVCAETRVGVLAERSIEHVLGMLAVLKAGGTWLPLDPHAPVARNAAQLADSGAAVLLHAGVLPAGIDGIVTLPLAWHPAGTAPHSASDTAPDGGARAPCVAVHPDQAAYMIYTSGSTGAPKGVVVSHRALADYVAGMLDTLDVGADASFAMVSTPAADLGHTVLFGALCSGRTLHLLAAECVFNPDRFADYMAAHRVDVLKIVPGHLAALLSAARARDVLPREALILGGESTSAELLDAVRALAAPCRIFNHYGPTETTVGVAMYALPADAGAGRALPLGTALPHVRLRVLDARMAPVAPGGEGELHVGGTSVARGYWGKPGLTAERFVPDAEVPGARCYRTGDRGRVDDTGLLEYLGRTDDQVKIRGYRVEPGEIAGVLRRLDGVRDAAVLAHDTPAGKRLTAFVAGGSGRDAVLAYAARCLPDHMVPADVIVLDTLPLNANGKLDRAALRGLLARASAASAANAAVRAAAADATTIGGTAADTAVVGVTALDPAVGDPAVGDATAGDARTVDATAGDATAGGDTAWVGATEPVLARIWAEAIGVPPEAIRRDHNFFEVGGDSILGLKVVAKARKAGLSITPKQLFQRLTLAALAAQVASRPAASGGAPAMPSVPSAVAARADAAERAAIIRLPEAARMRTPASHAQQRQWFLWQLAPQSSAYHIAGGLWLTGTVDAPALRASLEAIVARHEVLRTRFVANEAGQVEQWIDAAARLDWREARLAPAQIEPVTRAWADTPFDLERGPLLRAALHHETSAAGAGGRCLLALALHHIVADGWSIQVLLEELVAHYRAALAGGAPCVAALPVQYADYAAWQRDWLEAGEQARQLAYWRATLGETHPVLALPTDAPRQARASYRAARHRVRLPAGLSQALRARAQASSATPFMVLLAAFQALLHRYTGQDDIRVGVPVANRHRGDLHHQRHRECERQSAQDHQDARSLPK